MDKEPTSHPFLVKSGDVIKWREASTKTEYYKRVAEEIEEKFIPSWLSLDKESMTGRVLNLPGKDDIEAGSTRKPSLNTTRGKPMPELSIPNVTCVEGTSNYGRFLAEPLEPGFGTTLGNVLRRVLLSSLPGAAVTWVRIEGIQHEFSPIPHVKEDVWSS
jgi:hypothetical protein